MFFSAIRCAAVLGVATIFSVGCGPDQGTGTVHTSGKPDLAQGSTGDLSVVPFDGGFSDKCGVQDFMLQPGLPPEVMLILDRSGSMTSTFGAGTRWSEITAAVKSVVTSLQGSIAWGLTYFPTDSDCGTSSTVAVNVAPMNATQIGMSIDATSPDGNTPTAEAIKKAAAVMISRTTQNPKYLLLATDGEPNCGSVTPGTCTCVLGTPNGMGQCCLGPICSFPCLPISDDVATTTAAMDAAAGQGVHTFVIGVAASGDGTLNKLAVAGKEPRTGSQKYYPATSQADLVTAVNTIAGQIISCSFALTTPPPADLDLVDITLNGTAIPHDPTHANGWDLGGLNNNSALVFYGTACANLQTLGAAAVQAVYRCPPTL